MARAGMPARLVGPCWDRTSAGAAPPARSVGPCWDRTSAGAAPLERSVGPCWDRISGGALDDCDGDVFNTLGNTPLSLITARDFVRCGLLLHAPVTNCSIEQCSTLQTVRPLALPLSLAPPQSPSEPLLDEARNPIDNGPLCGFRRRPASILLISSTHATQLLPTTARAPSCENYLQEESSRF